MKTPAVRLGRQRDRCDPGGVSTAAISILNGTLSMGVLAAILAILLSAIRSPGDARVASPGPLLVPGAHDRQSDRAPSSSGREDRSGQEASLAGTP